MTDPGSRSGAVAAPGGAWNSPHASFAVSLNQHRAAIRAIVGGHRARNPRGFGSVARGDDRIDSDIGLLVDADSDASLFDLGAIQFEVQQLSGVRVDVLTPGDLPDAVMARVAAEAVPLVNLPQPDRVPAYLDIVWTTVERDVPQLLAELQQVRAELGSQ